LRHHAGLLLSQPHSAPKGTAAAILDDFQGGEVRVSLDPSLGPAENAEHMYETARKRERAATRLPQLIANARREAERVAGLVEDLRAGALPPEDAASAKLARAAPRQARALPYKRYRTSGGLEVRVGRGARTNDDLTFHHSRPDDIWLHARDAGGAHVILRWEDRDANPPAADLREAAILAAVQSKARTSGVVPVDWTRRKYVRKPRKAPPGRVTIERAKTLFVEPDAALAERLRVEEG
jgi:predicted ribosome quality control (RQC) complex YloA/Tae2 family protein